MTFQTTTRLLCPRKIAQEVGETFVAPYNIYKQHVFPRSSSAIVFGVCCRRCGLRWSAVHMVDLAVDELSGMGISVIFKRVERVHGARTVVRFFGRRGVGSWKRKE